jgi:hypothetical protein
MPLSRVIYRVREISFDFIDIGRPAGAEQVTGLKLFNSFNSDSRVRKPLKRLLRHCLENTSS